MLTMFLHPLDWFKTDAVTSEVIEREEEINYPKIVLIHGANQSNMTFAHLRHVLSDFDYINIDYSPAGDFYDNLNEMISLTESAGPTYIIGHSLGGIYAAHLSQYINCIGGATVSTPFGGSRAADFVKFLLPNYKIFKSVGQKARPVVEARKFKLPGNWTNYVSISGNVPWHGERNDGVLSIKSMTAKEDIPTTMIDANHYEIVLDESLINDIKLQINIVTNS